jgi:hypothetical protein
MDIDLEELERVAADYDRRKEAARKFEIENFGSTTEERARYLAALKYGEATKAFETLRPLVERVRELEAENARLKKQCEHLACDVVSAAQDYSAPMSDCRICDYDRFCKRKPSQIEPNWDMCEEAVLKACEQEEAGE